MMESCYNDDSADMSRTDRGRSSVGDQEDRCMPVGQRLYHDNQGPPHPPQPCSLDENGQDERESIDADELGNHHQESPAVATPPNNNQHPCSTTDGAGKNSAMEIQIVDNDRQYVNIENDSSRKQIYGAENYVCSREQPSANDRSESLGPWRAVRNSKSPCADEIHNFCQVQGYSIAAIMKLQNETHVTDVQVAEPPVGFVETCSAQTTSCNIQTSPDRCKMDVTSLVISNTVSIPSGADANQGSTLHSTERATFEGGDSAQSMSTSPCVVESDHVLQERDNPKEVDENVPHRNSQLQDPSSSLYESKDPTASRPVKSTVKIKVRYSPREEVGSLCDSASDFVPIKTEPVDTEICISPGTVSTSPGNRRFRLRNSPKQFTGKPANFVNMEGKRLVTLLRPKAKRKRSPIDGTKLLPPTPPQQEESSRTISMSPSNDEDSPQGSNDGDNPKLRKSKKSGQPVLVFHQVIPPRPRAPMREETPPESSNGLISSMLRNIAEQIQEPNPGEHTGGHPNPDPDTSDMQHPQQQQQPLQQVPPNSHRPQITAPMQPGLRRRAQLRFSDYSNWFTSQNYLSRQGLKGQAEESGFAAWKRAKCAEDNLTDPQRHSTWTNWPANADERIAGAIHAPRAGPGGNSVRDLLQRSNESGASLSRLPEALKGTSRVGGSGVGIVPTATVAAVVGSSNYSYSQQDILRQYLTNHADAASTTCQNISSTIPTSVMDSHPVMTTHIGNPPPARQVRSFRWAQSSHLHPPDHPGGTRKRVRLISEESRNQSPPSTTSDVTSNQSTEPSSSHRIAVSLSHVPVSEQQDIKPDIKTLSGYKYPSTGKPNVRPSGAAGLGSRSDNPDSLIRHLLLQGTSSTAGAPWEQRIHTSTSNEERPLLPHEASSTDAHPQPGSSSGTEEETKTAVIPLKRNSRVDLDTGQTQTTSYTCEHCDVIFSDSVMYILHMGCHGRHSAFECNQCGATFRDKYEFTIHFIQGEHSPK